jgi:type IV pilus assembly protein PilO
MNLRLTKKQSLISVLALLLTALLFFVGYNTFLRPLEQEMELLESDLMTEQQLLQAANEKTGMPAEQLIKSSVELQKRLPVKPFTEQFLLELEKAEVMSDSLILSMQFSDEEELDLGTGAAGEEKGPEKRQMVMNEETGTITPEEKQTGTEAAENVGALPVGLQKVTVQISVESQWYKDLLTFIETVEKSRRISQVEKISFQGPQEPTTLAETESLTIQYELTISTYYHPALEELRKDIPAIDIPEPGEKEDPFQTLINN